MAELLILIATLAIVLIGVALIVQSIAVEDVVRFIGRAFVVVVLMLVVLCILKGVWLGVVIPYLSAAFVSLKTFFGWFLPIAICLVFLLLVGRLALRHFGRYLTLRRDPQIGDGYDINDSKDAKN